MNTKVLVNGLTELGEMTYTVLPILFYGMSHPIKIRRKEMAVKTTGILLKNGLEGRGVKLTAKNIDNVVKWLDKDDILEHGAFDRIKILTGPNHKQPRVATIDDTVVKIGKGKKSYALVIKVADFDKFVSI